MKLHIVGDSHIDIYGYFTHPNYAVMFHSAYMKNMPYCMNKIGREGLTNLKLDFESIGANEGDCVLYVLGEPDCRIHIYRQIMERNRSEDEVIDTLAKSFVDGIKQELEKHVNITVIVRFVLPPREHSFFPGLALYEHLTVNGGFIPLGTLEDRVRYTNKLNSLLAHYCSDCKNLHFLPSREEFIKESGELKNEIMTNQTHFSVAAIPLLYPVLTNLLDQILMK